MLLRVSDVSLLWLEELVSGLLVLAPDDCITLGQAGHDWVLNSVLPIGLFSTTKM